MALTVAGALRGELSVMRAVAPDLADSALAAAALALARSIDNAKTSPTAKSMCARELREVLDRLRELMPEGEERDELDELSSRRTERRAAGGTGT